mgnify:CR=1 FL=1
MPRSKRSPLVAKAIRTANEQLAKMPSSPEVLALKGVISAIQEEVAVWEATPPASDQREGVMKRVLAIHLAITRLARPRR